MLLPIVPEMMVGSLPMPLEHRAPAHSGGKSFLNEPQLRHFEVFLSMLGTALSEIERLARHTLENTQEDLIIYDPDLPHNFAGTSGPAIDAIRHEVGSLAHALNIEPKHRSRLRTVKALLTAELVRLDDSYARKLRGYGTVSPRVEAEVDPILHRIRTQLVALLQACEPDPRGSTPKTRL